MVKRFVLLMILFLLCILVGCEAPYGYRGNDDLGNGVAACSAKCAPLPPRGFDGPVLLWAGDPAEVPACPEQAPEIVFEGYEGLNDEPVECAPCACSPAKCKLPAGVIASTDKCGLEDAETIYTPALAPASWDGSCITPTQVPPELLDAMILLPVTEEPCAPVVEVPERSETGPPFTTRARACGGAVTPERCQDPGHTCHSADEAPPPGFRRCLQSLRPGEASCPADYPDEISFFTEVTDERGCAPCTCTQTTPSQCSALLGTYSDMSCSYLAGILGMWMSSTPLCGGVIDNQTLRSMSAEWMTNVPGTCAASGGEPSGEVTLRGLQTFCCKELSTGAEADPD